MEPASEDPVIRERALHVLHARVRIGNAVGAVVRKGAEGPRVLLFLPGPSRKERGRYLPL